MKERYEAEPSKYTEGNTDSTKKNLTSSIYGNPKARKNRLITQHHPRNRITSQIEIHNKSRSNDIECTNASLEDHPRNISKTIYSNMRRPAKGTTSKKINVDL